MKNYRVYFPQVRKAEVVEIEMPVPKPDEYLIKSRLSLVSTGTEMTAYCGEFDPGTTWEKDFSCPYLPGYTNIGEVIDCGKDADRSWIGKRVATNRNHQAYSVSTISNPFTGSQAAGRTCFRSIPDGLSDEEMVFFSIPTIVMNGIRASQVKWGECAVVFGQGLLGQFATRFLRLAGAFPVFACDVSDYRLSLLPKDPAIIPVNTKKQDIAKLIEEKNSGRKADCLIELTSNADLLPLEASLLREKGRLVILSSPKKPTTFDFEDFCAWPSISIIGCHNFSHPIFPQMDNPWTSDRHYELYCDLLKYKMIDVKPLISRLIDFHEAPEAYKALDANRGNEMGVIFDWRNI